MPNKKITKQKQQGQYMTPSKIVDLILDTIGYNGIEILDRNIMEPSFGDGAFLINIVERIIQNSQNVHKSNIETAQILEEHIYGIEKDEFLYHKAIERLNEILKKYEIPTIKWTNLVNDDTLIIYRNYVGKMDYVVGNPPFVRVKNIPMEYRDVMDKFEFSDGLKDLYIIFYEIGLKMLNDKGMLGYISPNSFMKNISQKKFRKYLIDERLISKIYDFKTSRIFNASTYTCICILDNDKNRHNFDIFYKEYDMYEIKVENIFSYDDFKSIQGDHEWVLASKEDINFIENNKKKKKKFNGFATIQNGISTNQDATYIFKVYEDKECTVPYMGKHSDKQKYVFFKYGNRVVNIENTILHRCVKESTYNGIMDNTYIIFPYKEIKEKDSYKTLNEQELKEGFPYAYQYFLSVFDELSKRDMEDNVPWFAFARSQGILNMPNKKIIFKHIIDRKKPIIVPYIIDEDVIIYAGIYITLKDKDLGRYEQEKEFSRIKEIISSNDFARYCTIFGKDMQNGYVNIQPKYIKKYGIS